MTGGGAGRWRELNNGYARGMVNALANYAEMLPAGGEARVDWRCKAVAEGSAKVTMSACGHDGYDTPNGPAGDGSITLAYGACAGDLNDDGLVNVVGLLALLAGWGNPYGINDLLDLLAAWGPCR